MKLAAALRHLLRQPWLFTAVVGLCGGIAMLALYVGAAHCPAAP